MFPFCLGLGKAFVHALGFTGVAFLLCLVLLLEVGNLCLCLVELGLQAHGFRCLGFQGVAGAGKGGLQGLHFVGVALALFRVGGVGVLQFCLEVVGAFGGFFCAGFGGGELAAQGGVFMA